MKLLIVEDSDSIQKLISVLLVARGHEVTTASNGTRGLELALAEPFDLILLDLNLPGSIDGLEVCRRVRGNPGTVNVPIFIVSALLATEAEQKSLEAGAARYFEKPFSPTALLREVERIGPRA